MKKAIFLSLGFSVAFATVANAQLTLPFSDDFESGSPSAEWQSPGSAFANGDLNVVTSDTDWRGTTINPPANGGSNFAKLSYGATTYSTAWRLLGDGTEKDYVVTTDMYVPVVDDSEEPDDYLYQIIFIAADGPNSVYTRAHFHMNEAGVAGAPRIRVQSTYDGFETWIEESGITGFTEGWKEVGVVSANTDQQVEMFYDGTSVTGGPVSVTNSTFADGGQMGFGEFVDGDTTSANNGINGPRSVYIDNFNVTAFTDVQDWVVYE